MLNDNGNHHILMSEDESIRMITNLPIHILISNSTLTSLTLKENRLSLKDMYTIFLFLFSVFGVEGGNVF
ncbi:hypothetical protein D3C87_1778500 [compost metagenome]